ncbi:MAG: 5'-nucleotidase C-terminal domain-containing protein [Prolixibacteraceae bacterium]|jgi:2',3'-cyclic-nucleotide 2'-phosphodiesterase (5'-nucleotidase family)|nr:5'-nucleotidase C-terminal domain-containing protein [Prolixibacteraceae bacterium]
MMKNILLLLILVGSVSCSTNKIGIVETITRNIPVTDSLSTENQILIELLSPYKQKLEADMSRVLAISDVEMIKGKPESNMTNFMADLLLEEARNYCKRNMMEAPSASYVNYGGIRSTLPRGEISMQKVFELMPFENTMMLLKISGENFQKMADMIAQREGEGVAGIKMGIRDKSVSSLLVGGEKFDAGKSYWIVTNDYIAGGGDNMTMFLQPESLVSTGITIRDIIVSHLENKTKNGQHITAQADGRIFYE